VYNLFYEIERRVYIVFSIEQINEPTHSELASGDAWLRHANEREIGNPGMGNACAKSWANSTAMGVRKTGGEWRTNDRERITHTEKAEAHDTRLRVSPTRRPIPRPRVRMGTTGRIRGPTQPRIANADDRGCPGRPKPGQIWARFTWPWMARGVLACRPGPRGWPTCRCPSPIKCGMGRRIVPIQSPLSTSAARTHELDRPRRHGPEAGV
jgi:hypothetical protein